MPLLNIFNANLEPDDRESNIKQKKSVILKQQETNMVTNVI